MAVTAALSLPLRHDVQDETFNALHTWLEALVADRFRVRMLARSKSKCGWTDIDCPDLLRTRPSTSWHSRISNHAASPHARGRACGRLSIIDVYRYKPSTRVLTRVALASIGHLLLVLTFAIAVLQPSHHILTTVAAAIVFAAIDHFLKLTAANSIFPVGLFPASYLLMCGISWPGSSDSRSSPAYALKIGTLYAINCLILLSILTETSDFFDGQNHTPFAPYLAAGLTALLTLFIEQKHDSAAFGLSRYSVALSCVAGIIWSTHHNFSARVDVALLQASMSCTKDPNTCDRFVGLFMTECAAVTPEEQPLNCRQVEMQVEAIGCAYGVQTRCRRLGLDKLKSSQPSTQQEGRRLMSKACSDGLIEACIDLAQFLEENDPHASALRRRVSRIACDHGDRHGCRCSVS